MNNNQVKLSTHYERIEAVLNKLPYTSTELMKATAVSAVYHSTDSEGKVTYTTLRRLYKHLQDDFDLTRGGAESRITSLKRDMFNTLPKALKYTIFGEVDKVPNYIFILKLSEFVVGHW